MAKKSTEEAPKQRETPAQSAAPPVTPTSTGPQAVPAPTSPRPLPPKEGKDAGESSRISLKVVDGKVDFASLQDRTADKVREVFRESVKDPAILEWAGIGPSPALTIGTVLTPADAGMLLDIIAMLETFGVALKLKITVNESRQFIFWTPAEHSIIDPKVAPVLSKYMPENWKANLDWALALGTFLSMSMIKFSMAAKYAEAKAKGAPSVESPKTPAPAPSSVPTPVPASDAAPIVTGKPNGDATNHEEIAAAATSGAML